MRVGPAGEGDGEEEGEVGEGAEEEEELDGGFAEETGGETAVEEEYHEFEDPWRACVSVFSVKDIHRAGE